jgi:ATP-dependent protease ClpP protease subunit
MTQTLTHFINGEKVSADTDRDFIMTAVDAKTYGLIDEVIESRKLQEQRLKAS